MSLLHIITALKQQTGWTEYNYEWIGLELAKVGKALETGGDHVHAVVIGAYDSEGSAYYDFSTCDSPAGSHGFPPEPKTHRLPCLTLLVRSSRNRVIIRDETAVSSMAEA